MKDRFPELEQVRVVVDRSTRDRQIAAIENALAERRTVRFRGRRFLAVAVALILLIPVLSLAARDSVPGDFLYPVKLAFDPVTDAVGLTAGAEARVGEVEAMVDRRMDVAVIRDHADLAIDRLVAEERAIEERLALVDRLERATDGLEGMTDVRTRLGDLTDELDVDPPPDRPASTGAEQDRPTTTIDSSDDRSSSDTTATTNPTGERDSGRDRSERP